MAAEADQGDQDALEAEMVVSEAEVVEPEAEITVSQELQVADSDVEFDTAPLIVAPRRMRFHYTTTPETHA